MAVGAGVPVAVLIVLTVSLLNQRAYGYFGISEFSAPELSAIMGALARVEPAQHRRWVIVSTETRARIYPHSPAFRELEVPFQSRLEVWHIAGPMMFDWDQKAKQEEIDTGTLLGTVCQEEVAWDDAAMHAEIMTGWFVIALREAVIMAGHYQTQADALAFMARVASEVNAVCDAGILACGPPRASLAPPLRLDEVGLILRRTCRGAARLLTLADIQQFPSLGTEQEMADIQLLTGDTLIPIAGTPAPPLSPVQTWNAARLAELHSLYAAVLPWAAAVAVATALGLAVRLGRGGSWPLLGPVLVLLAAAGARLALLAYMDATAFPRSLIPLYMLPIYPQMFAVILLVIIDGARPFAGHGLPLPLSWRRRTDATGVQAARAVPSPR